MTSATDELRRLLDERGVEHYDGTESTLWLKDEHGYRASANELTSGRLSVHIWCDTPEHAIAATLGAGECTDTGRYCFTCSECGWTENEPHHAFGCFWPNYCPNCGRRIEVDDG